MANNATTAIHRPCHQEKENLQKKKTCQITAHKKIFDNLGFFLALNDLFIPKKEISNYHVPHLKPSLFWSCQLHTKFIGAHLGKKTLKDP